MTFEQQPVILTGQPSFETVLDKACELLREKQIHHSILRIREMEGELDRLEKELNAFLGPGYG